MQLSILIILAFAIFPFSLMAEPSSVQSGEHENFTRLVIQVPDGRSWSIDQEKRKVTLTFVGHQAGFDTSQIFNFIPRDRIQGIETSQSTLTILMGCDCEVINFPVNGGYVAIDVASNNIETAATQISIGNVRPPVSLNSRGSKPTLHRIPTIGNSISKTGVSITSTSKQVDIISDVQSNLLRALGNATSRGILDPKLEKFLGHQSQIDVSVFKNLTTDKNTARTPSHLPKTGNILISTSLDAPQLTNPNQEIMSVTGIICPSFETLDIASWGDERSFEEQINETRFNLFNEVDQVNTDVVLKLARLYLYFGFGAEASQVLRLDPKTSDQRGLLFEIAEIMETGSAKNNSLYELRECDGNISLWAFLAHTQKIHDMDNDSSVLLALEKLPTHLRNFIAPEVSSHFLLQGNPENAAVALRSLERLPDPVSPKVTLAQANIDIDHGNAVKGVYQLEELATNSADQAPLALVALVNAKIESGELISPDIIELIEAYLHELRDTEIELDLQRAHIFSLVQSGQFDNALSKIGLTTPIEKSKESENLERYFINQLTRNASDIIFLDIALQESPAGMDSVDSTSLITIANRLLKLGFALDAQKILQRIPDNPINESRQILAAEIALALDQPFQAQAELLGMNSKPVKIIRAKAQQITGAHEEAHIIFQDVDLRRNAIQSAWLSETWQELTPPETPVFGPVAALASSETLALPSSVGMLNRSQVALTESSEARRILNNLLNASQLGSSENAF